MNNLDLIRETAERLPRKQRIAFLKAVIERLEKGLAEKEGVSYEDARRIKKSIFHIRAMLDNIELNPDDDPDKQIEILLAGMAPPKRVPFLKAAINEMSRDTTFDETFKKARIRKFKALIDESEHPKVTILSRENVN